MKTAILKSTCIALLMGNMFSCDVLERRTIGFIYGRRYLYRC